MMKINKDLEFILKAVHNFKYSIKPINLIYFSSLKYLFKDPFKISKAIKDVNCPT